MLDPAAIVMLVIGCVVFYGGTALFVWIALRKGSEYTD
ncbi:MAG: MetS family NSS transporter small subunit [Candidatus Methanoliparum thermophilum]|uniref:MetS family NSS transporter small subunit n=1 Tax=Methanoliparum thermophilum TaxID=2491083 RepID=A0A520KRN4_METT2|nr:MAG: MetS family NSS transporter small subunit [Candidatus Methanoliparum thermophilum]BDC35961.1 hypothetical protein MTLP_06430 [Candidatus Methanoliparum sp. LAM-1]